MFFVKGKTPLIIGKYNDVSIEAKIYTHKHKDEKKKYTEISVKHVNDFQQKIKIINKTKFSKLSLIDTIHKNLGYNYRDYNFTDNHILYSTTKINNKLSSEKLKTLSKLDIHEIRIDEKILKYSEPRIIDNHNRLIDLSSFLVDLSHEINNNNLNQIQEVIIR